MKRNIYVLILALITIGAYSQTHEVHKEFGQAWGGGASVDINNDGHLDFYITGQKNNPAPSPDSERWNRLYFYNPGTHDYDSTGTNLNVIDRANLDWADIDGDGLVDLLGAEHSWSNYHSGVYKNLGDGQFDSLGWPMPSKTMAAAWADFNNDGWLDYVCISNDSAASAVMINNGDNTFETTNTEVFDGLYFGLGYVEVLDYNNDGFMDFFLSANVDNVDKSANDDARVISDIFINYDEEPGNFFRAYLGKTDANTAGMIYMKGNGGVDFADFNSDGWVDMVLHGEGGSGTLEPSGGADIWSCISHVYLNQQDGTFADKPQAAFQADLRPLNSTGVATAAIDWNVDGHYDLILTGWNPPTVNTQSGYLYHGDGAGNFAEVGRVPGGSETVLLFNDWNDDGVLDYLVSGHCWDAMWYAAEEVGRTASVFFNTNTGTANVKPGAPTNLAADVSGRDVTLSWDAATDDLTPAATLSYEYFLKDGEGNFMTAPASFVGGDMDGKRHILKLGNAYLNTFAILQGLPDDTYTWGVQAIDASYEGSAFATGTFTVTNVGTSKIKSVPVADIYSFGNTLVVRTLEAEDALVSVYNLIGQRIASRNISGEFQLNLPQGIYIVSVETDSNIQTGKVFIR
ncbi:MAG: T9SS type A sorting domain-containing protein [Bacteroidales bacterium]|nr:T9SS type A sorting domain-containing protein [Bacteroidales bacterium]